MKHILKSTGIIILLLCIIFTAFLFQLKNNPANNRTESYTDAVVVAKAINCSKISDTVAQTLSTKTKYKIFDINSYYDYEGYIGKYKIALSLYYDENKVTGTYVYDKYRKEIKIDGTIKYNKMTLNEYDKYHNILGRFYGIVKDDDTISGTWKPTKDSKEYKFKLVSTTVLSGCEYNHRYLDAGFSQDKDAVEYVKKFQEYVKKDDALNISKLLMYPITVTIENQYVDIKNKKQFIKNYKKIFTAEFKNTIKNAYTTYMFANYRGLMFGANLQNVWISYVVDTEYSGIRIITINN